MEHGSGHFYFAIIGHYHFAVTVIVLLLTKSVPFYTLYESLISIKSDE